MAFYKVIVYRNGATHFSEGLTLTEAVGRAVSVTEALATADQRPGAVGELRRVRIDGPICERKS